MCLHIYTPAHIDIVHTHLCTNTHLYSYKDSNICVYTHSTMIKMTNIVYYILLSPKCIAPKKKLVLENTPKSSSLR